MLDAIEIVEVGDIYLDLVSPISTYYVLAMLL